MKLLKENKDKINWICLFLNPKAIKLLKENKDKNMNCFLYLKTILIN
jgi:hypothetical protein